jgi:nicotinamide mononucleotide transporter
MPMSNFEIWAVVFGVLSVWLSVRQNVWNWPAGIVNVALYVIVFAQSRLYADMALQVVYIVLACYGWYQWLYGGAGRTTLPVARAPAKHMLIASAVGVVGAVVLGLVLARRTNAALPYMDASLAAGSLVAQYLMTKKYVENWTLWIVVDVIYVGMYLFKSLYLTAGLYAIFVALAMLGLRDWRRALRTQAQPALA